MGCGVASTIGCKAKKERTHCLCSLKSSFLVSLYYWIISWMILSRLITSEEKGRSLRYIGLHLLVWRWRGTKVQKAKQIRPTLRTIWVERSDWSKRVFSASKWRLIKDKLQVLQFGLRASNVSIEGENTLISTKDSCASPYSIPTSPKS